MARAYLEPYEGFFIELKNANYPVGRHEQDGVLMYGGKFKTPHEHIYVEWQRVCLDCGEPVE